MLFLDASVLIAASYSLSGASALILGLGRKGKLKLVISPEVIEEVKRNAAAKLNLPQQERLKFFFHKINFRIYRKKDKELIGKCKEVINPQDALILAAGISSKAKFLLTFDRKHFLTKEVQEFTKPLKIMTPGDYVQKYLCKDPDFSTSKRKKRPKRQ